MNQYKVDFNQIQRDTPATGVRSNVLVINGKKIRLVEFTKEFIGPDWCKKGHIGYIVEGQLELTLTVIALCSTWEMLYASRRVKDINNFLCGGNSIG
jgi:hypothetical protein